MRALYICQIHDTRRSRTQSEPPERRRSSMSHSRPMISACNFHRCHKSSLPRSSPWMTGTLFRRTNVDCNRKCFENRPCSMTGHPRKSPSRRPPCHRWSCCPRSCTNSDPVRPHTHRRRDHQCTRSRRCPKSSLRPLATDTTSSTSRTPSTAPTGSRTLHWWAT